MVRLVRFNDTQRVRHFSDDGLEPEEYLIRGRRKRLVLASPDSDTVRLHHLYYIVWLMEISPWFFLVSKESKALFHPPISKSSNLEDNNSKEVDRETGQFCRISSRRNGKQRTGLAYFGFWFQTTTHSLCWRSSESRKKQEVHKKGPFFWVKFVRKGVSRKLLYLNDHYLLHYKWPAELLVFWFVPILTSLPMD